MKNLKTSFGLIIMVFLSWNYSCTNTESFNDFEKVNHKSLVDEVQTRILMDCGVDLNNMEITMSWSEDCSTAVVSLAACCDCELSDIGRKCYVPAGYFDITYASCPSIDFYKFDISEMFLAPQTCEQITFELEAECTSAIDILQIYFNGEPLEVDSDYDGSCN